MTLRAKAVATSLGSLASLASFAFLVPALIAWFAEPRDVALFGTLVPRNALVFALLFVMVGFGGQSIRLLAGKPPDLRDIEGYVVVASSWIILPLLYALPYRFTTLRSSWIDAVFEGMSGLSTTGFTVIADVDALPPSLLFWRSFTQWLGGMGIAIIAVAVLARLTQSGVRLMRAELPGGNVTRLRPTLAQTAKSLYKVYLSVSVIIFLALFAALFLSEGMSPATAAWEALLLSFSTIATGGFAPHSAGIGYYESAWVRHTLLVGMLVGGTSMTLLWFATHGEPRRLTRDPEFRSYVGVVLLASLLLTILLLVTPATVWAQHGEAWNALGAIEERSWTAFAAAFPAAIFHATSLLTTTGFSYVDFDAWPESARIVLVLLLFPGGCLGSTAGALKLARVVILTKVARREILKLVNPNATVPVRVAGAVVSEDAVRGIIAFFFAYLATFIASTIVVAMFGFDVVTSASVSAASIAGAGLGLGVSGPCCTLAEWHPLLKGWLTFVIWLGRLEIFAGLLLFFPSTYRR